MSYRAIVIAGILFLTGLAAILVWGAVVLVRLGAFLPSVLSAATALWILTLVVSLWRQLRSWQAFVRIGGG